MSQRLVHCDTVLHGANAIGYAESVTWDERAQAVPLGPNDNDLWPDFLIAVNRSVTATANFQDAASLEDTDLVIGASATLVAKGRDPAGTVANDVILNIANAVITGKGGTFATQREARFALQFSAYSADGTTNPVSYT
jgi:hypothetical protein